MKNLSIVFVLTFLFLGTFKSKAQTELDYYSQAYDIILANKDSLKYLLFDTISFNPDEVSICVSSLVSPFSYATFSKLIVKELFPFLDEYGRDSLSQFYVVLNDERLKDSTYTYHIDTTLKNMSDAHRCNCNFVVIFSNISEGNVFEAQVYNLRDGVTIEYLERSITNFEDSYYLLFVIENGQVRKIFSAIAVS